MDIVWLRISIDKERMRAFRNAGRIERETPKKLFYRSYYEGKLLESVENIPKKEIGEVERFPGRDGVSFSVACLEADEKKFLRELLKRLAEEVANMRAIVAVANRELNPLLKKVGKAKRKA
jgi:hypothetical protein